jgi:outer membrane protein assembly factor BamB
MRAFLAALVVGALLGLVPAAYVHAADSPVKVLGWRGDGTGIYKDADPVTEWSRLPKSPNTGLRTQVKKPAADDDGRGARPVQSGQILEWLVAGPFTAKDPAAPLDQEFLPGEAALAPDEGQKAGDLAWAKHLSVTKDPGVNMDWIQLGDLAGRKPGKVVYAHNYLYSAVKGTIVFHMDQAAGCKIWVNGKVVHNHPKPVVTMNTINYVCYAAATHWAGELPLLGESASQKIRVDLQEGWNRVLLKSGGNLNLRLVEAPETEYETKNIIWAARLPSYSNAQPVIVGDRIFVMSESEDLIALDKASGKILWKRSTFYTDCLSDAEKQSSAPLKQAAELTEKLRTATATDERIKRRNEIKMALAEADKESMTADPRYADIRPLQEKLKDAATPEAERPALLAKVRTLLEKVPGPKEENALLAAVLPLEEAAKAPDTKDADREAIRRKVEETLVGAAPRPRFRLPIHDHIQGTGFTNPTPCSDGKYVYIYLGWGIVACYDLDGRRRWARLATDLGGLHAFNNNAPVLVGGTFVILRNVQMRGYDAATGAIAWTTADLRPQAHVDVWHGFGTDGNPSASLCTFKLGAKDVAWLNSAIVGVDDGKIYAPFHENFGSNPRGTPVPLGDALYYAANCSVFRFALPAEASVGMKLPKQQQENYEADVDTYASVLVHDGLLYALRGEGKLWVYDARTLAVVYSQQLDMESYHDYDHPGVVASLSLAGKYIYAFDNQGHGIVLAPGRRFKQVARNRIGTCVSRRWVLDPDEIFHSAPVFEGGRLYLRGEEYLYCIGEK